MKLFDVAIVGATGLVGRKVIEVLKKRKFPLRNLKLFASEKSIGKEIKFGNRIIKVEKLDEKTFHEHEFIFFTAGSEISKKYVPLAIESGVIVIDNSSFYRMQKDVPLVVPEVNPFALLKHNKIIANPNCSTIQMVVTLKPLHDLFHIKRIVVTTFQSVSGAGQRGIDQLENETKKNSNLKKFPHQILHNIIPQVDEFVYGNNTKEEIKMIDETKKIFNDSKIQISATCTRVPVFYSHSESVNIQFKKEFKIENIFSILKKNKNITIIDDIKNKLYPMPLYCANKDDIFVGRIRKDESIKNGLNLWIVADNVRKGAATNAVQIAEEMIKRKLV